MIAWVTTNTTTCGGMIIPFEYVSRLKKLGIETDIFAEQGNKELEDTYGIKVRPLSELQTTEDDVIIATRWEQCEMLSHFPGKKYQFVQGDDIQLLGDDSQRQQCSLWRLHHDWDLIGVSKYVLSRWNRGVVIPNAVNDRFLNQPPVDRDIDILIEGNNEPNKNIGEAVRIAKQTQLLSGRPLKIVWLGRETEKNMGVECVTNPKQKDIPAIYNRSKVMIKLSKSEGFCLPILEAFASGCLVVTTNMGGNDDWCQHGKNCLMVDDCFASQEIKEHIETDKHRWIAEGGKMTVRDFSWNKSINKLLLYVTGRSN